MSRYYSLHFGADYQSGTYGACAYSEGCAASTTGADSGSLVNTGVMVAGLVTLACLIIFVALVVRWWRRPAKVVPETVEVQDDTPPPPSDSNNSNPLGM